MVNFQGNFQGNYQGVINGIGQLVNFSISNPNIIFNKNPITLNFIQIDRYRYSVTGKITIATTDFGITIADLSGVAYYNARTKILNLIMQGQVTLNTDTVFFIINSNISTNSYFQNNNCCNIKTLYGDSDFLGIGQGQAGIIGVAEFVVSEIC